MYMTPTDTRLSNGSPVRPSYRIVLASLSIPASLTVSQRSSELAPSKTGVAMWMPRVRAAIPR